MSFLLIEIECFRRFCKIAKSDYELRHVRPYVGMEQFFSHWTNFYDICYSNILRKSVE